MRGSWVVLVASVFAACDGGAGEEADRVDTILALEGDAGAGAGVYSAQCSICHGPNGEGQGSVYPAIAGTALSDEDFAARILDGDATMPAFADALDDQQIADCMAFVRSL